MEKKQSKKKTSRLYRAFRHLEGVLYLLKTIISERQFLYVSCVLVGASSSLAVILLKTFAHTVFEFTSSMDALLKLPYFNSILPVIGILLTVFVVKKFLDGSIEKGTSQIMIAVAKRSGYMPRKQMYAQILTSSLTVGMGGSAGLESPITITGAAFGSNFAQNFRFNYKDRTLLLACGVAAGIAAAFNAPIAGVLFAIEVILADMSVTAFIPLMISSATGAIVSAVVLKDNIILNFKNQFVFDYSNTFYYVLVGIAAGFFSIYHARMFRRIEHFASRLPYDNPYKKAFIGAGMLAVLIFLFPTLFGEGYESIKSLADDNATHILEHSLLEKLSDNPWIVLVFVGCTAFIKSIATGLTLGSGGNGGNFAPSLFVGSYLGYVIAKFIELIGLKKLPIENFTVVGMAAVLSGLFHAPLTAIFLIAEITNGYGLMVPLLIVSSISFAISKRYDNYSMDIFSIADKGLVFTSDKDKNILNKIELHNIYNKVETLKITDSMVDVKILLATTNQTFIPVVNEQANVLGIIYEKELRSILFSDFKLRNTSIEAEMKPAITASLSENTGNVIKMMDDHHLSEVLLTQNNVLVGYVSKIKILETYRENLKNLRIE